MILDLKDAIMGIPLAKPEWGYNCCALDLDVKRNRDELYPGEPRRGRYIIWVVLGFGGRSNPLVFSRAAAFAARTAQALLRPTPDSPGEQSAAVGRLQMYVDDPIATYIGTPEQRERAADLLIGWWLSLGLPLSWAKGSLSSELHRWIGADFSTRLVRSVPAGIITVPPEFASELHDLLEPFSKKTGVVDEAATDRMLGKAGRLMYLIPSARPWVSSLWGALAGSKASNQGQHREAPPNHHAVRLFSSSARWLRTLLKPPDPTAALLPL